MRLLLLAVLATQSFAAPKKSADIPALAHPLAPSVLAPTTPAAADPAGPAAASGPGALPALERAAELSGDIAKPESSAADASGLSQQAFDAAGRAAAGADADALEPNAADAQAAPSRLLPASTPETRLFSALAEKHEPGTFVDKDQMQAAVKRAGLSGDSLREASKALIANGRLILSARGSLFVDLSARGETGNRAATLEAAQGAIKLLNSSAPADRLRAAARLYEAAQNYPDLPENAVAFAHKKQLRVLAWQAVAQVLDDAISNWAVKLVSHPEQNPAEAELMMGTRLRELVRSFGPEGQDPQSLDVTGAARLRELLKEYGAEGFASDIETKKGLRLAKKALPKAGSSEMPETVKPLAERVQDYIAKNLPAGSVFNEGLERSIAETLGVRGVDVFKAFEELAERGAIARLHGVQTFMTTEARQRAAAHDRPALHEADRYVWGALQAMNLQGFAETAQAVLQLRRALQLYKDRAPAEVPLLYKNALLALLDRGVAAEEPSDDDALNARRRAISSWLAERHFAAGVDPLQRAPAAPEGVAASVERLGSSKDAVIAAAAGALADFVAEPRGHVARMEASANDNSVVPKAPAAPGSEVEPLDKDKYEALTEYGTDITLQAARGELPPVIGREAETDEMIKTLARRTKNSPIAVGEAGIGKTALIEGVAQRIVKGDVPPKLRGKRIIRLDLNKMLAGTENRGQFEKRLQSIIEEARKSDGQIILFVDEIHRIINLGDTSRGSSGGGMSQAILEDLGRGRLSMIGATTPDKYRMIKADSALRRRFHGVMLEAPKLEQAVEILKGRRKEFQDEYGVTYDDKTLETAAKLAKRYITKNKLPDSALDLVDLAGAQAEMDNFKALKSGAPRKTVITPDDVAREIAKITRIPVERMMGDRKARLKGLEDRLNTKVIGQPDAVHVAAQAVKRMEVLKDPDRPEPLMFLGPTGVGKTELTKQLALEVFDDESAFTRIDMSEYMDRHSVARLIGAPPGYVGHGQVGALSKALDDRPYQVLLLDEIDKAHPDVLNVLLQILDHGWITDGEGNAIDCRHLVIVMTANYKGEHTSTQRVYGFTGRKGDLHKTYLEDAKANLPAELIGRIGPDNMVVFHEHDAKSLRSIADLKVADLQRLLDEKRITLTVDDSGYKHLVAQASTPENLRYGARPLEQGVKRKLKNALADALLDDVIAEGDSVTAKYVEETVKDEAGHDKQVGRWVIERAQ